MLSDTPIYVLALLAGLGAVGHFGLLVSARWLNVVMLACAAFLVVSPLSVATEMPGVEMLKWARVYLALLMLALYLVFIRRVHFGPASWAFMVFLGFYTLAAIWSDAPVAGVKFKVMYATVAVAGLLLASSIRDFREFRVDMRILTGAALLYALAVVAGIAREPGQLLSGRLSVWGWNANRVGHDAAAMLALCLFAGVYDKVKVWKLYSLGLASFFGFITLATGSRAAAGMAAVSCVIMIAPLFRRPVLLTTLTIFGGLVLNLIVKSISSDTLERFGEVDFSNRQMLWTSGLERFYDNPAAGAGWVYDTSARADGASANLHSIYVQILAETGLIGAALFALMLLVCGVRSLVILNELRRAPGAAPYTFFAFSLAGATLAHGVAESSSLQGTNLNGLLLPFAIGLLDRIPQMIRAEAGAEPAIEEYDPEMHGEYEGYGEEPQPA